MKIILFLIPLLFCFSCENKKTEQTTLEPTIEKTRAPTSANFYSKMDSLYQTGIFNGFSGTVVDSTGIIYNQGFGFADVAAQKEYTENTIINIASISKVFIGVALLKAQELNFLDLDDPIKKHLPFTLTNPNYPNAEITLRQLATHTSSIVDTDIYMETSYVNKDDVPLAENLKERYKTYFQNPADQWMSLAEYMTKLLKPGEDFYDTSSFSNRKPGELYDYSNVGAALCAFVIESASGQPFDKFTEEHIFKPLNMTSSGWFSEDMDSSRYSKLYFQDELFPYYTILSYPDGGLITSSTDLGNFLVEWIKGYSGNGTILNAASYQEIFKSQLDTSAFNGKENFNVGLFLDKELAYHVIGHTGGDPGTNTMMFFDTETRQGRIFIANTDSRLENSNEVFWGIWNVLGDY